MDPTHSRIWYMLSRLSIFGRLTLGYLTILALVVGGNLYILKQLRVLNEVSAELVARHFPAVETAKRLIASLYSQLKSDKQYLVLRDTALLKEFLQEAENFRKTLTALMEQETALDRRALLEKTKKLHEEYHTRFLGEAVEALDRSPLTLAQYERNRDALVEEMNEVIKSYILLQERGVGEVLTDAHARSVRAEELTRQLLGMLLLLGLGLAGIASYSILRPLRRVQGQIRRIGQGQFGKPMSVAVPHELRELVVTVNWMSEQLQQLEQMKTEFLANVSHELRTPLASIREGTQILLEEIPGTITPEQRETLKILLESSQRLNQLISSLLDLSRMEANVMAYQFAPTNLSQLCHHSVEKVRFLAERKHIQLIVEDEIPSDRVYAVDVFRMEQVLENLLSNAIKFSQEGSVVTLTAKPESESDSLKISVNDTGPGIAKEDLPHIFERFYQGKTPGGHPPGGSGIGLALAKKVIEAHHGEIWVESEVGKGTTVSVIIPANPEKEPS